MESDDLFWLRYYIMVLGLETTHLSMLEFEDGSHSILLERRNMAPKEHVL